MNDEGNRGIIERYWPAFDNRNATVICEIAHDDLVTEWPQSGERIIGKDNCLVVRRYARRDSQSARIRRPRARSWAKPGDRQSTPR